MLAGAQSTSYAPNNDAKIMTRDIMTVWAAPV